MTQLPDNQTRETRQDGSMPRGAAITPTDVSPRAADGPASSIGLAAMRARFEADFATRPMTGTRAADISRASRFK